MTGCGWNCERVWQRTRRVKESTHYRELFDTSMARVRRTYQMDTGLDRRLLTSRHHAGRCQLLARVFSIDVSECPDCGGQLKIIAALTDSASIRSYLEGVGLPARPPPITPARPSPQHELDPLLAASAA